MRYPKGVRLYHGRIELTRKGIPVRCPDAGLVARQAWSLLPVVQSLLVECQGATAWRAEKIKAWLWVLLCEIAGRQAPPQAPARRGLSPRQQLLIERALEESTHPDTTILARCLRLSPLYFRRQFKRTFGCPPREWIVRRRVHRAAALLSEGDRPAQEIAASLGYTDTRLFSRQFRQVMGVGPRAFRREQSAEEQPNADA